MTKEKRIRNVTRTLPARQHTISKSSPHAAVLVLVFTAAAPPRTHAAVLVLVLVLVFTAAAPCLYRRFFSPSLPLLLAFAAAVPPSRWCGSRMEGSSSSNEKNQIRLRHACCPKWLLQVNENLTDAQKNEINVTPFKWVVNIPTKLEICGNLLYELVTRWDERTPGFRVRGRVVPFMPIDVCLAIGLPVVGGERVPIDDDVNCYTSSFFGGSRITIDEIVNKLDLIEDEPGDFCRMYILLAFGEFYFPRSGRLSFTGCIKLLDDLDSLNSFNWGLAVYDFLVDSLTKTARAIKEGKNASQIHICGCAAILQIWAMNHLSVGETPSNPVSFPFPRFLNWKILRLTKKRITKAFEKNLITLGVTATNEELQFQMVRDALHQAEHQFVGITEYQQLVEELRQCRERIASLEAQVKVLTDSELQRQSTAEPHNTDMGGSFHASPVCPSPNTNIFASAEGCSDVQRGELPRSTPQEYASHGVDNPAAAVVGGLEEGNIEDGIGEQNSDGSVKSTSNIITRMKKNPRNRVKSVPLRTPFKATYARRRKGKKGSEQTSVDGI